MTFASPLRWLGLLSVLAASSAFADSAAPVATVKHLDADVRIDVLSLKRTENNTVTLQFALVNDGARDAAMALNYIQMIDLAARRRYDVGLKMAADCDAPSGTRKVCWVMFAAPPAATKSVNLQFNGSWPLVSAPISE